MVVYHLCLQCEPLRPAGGPGVQERGDSSISSTSDQAVPGHYNDQRLRNMGAVLLESVQGPVRAGPALEVPCLTRPAALALALALALVWHQPQHQRAQCLLPTPTVAPTPHHDEEHRLCMSVSRWLKPQQLKQTQLTPR